MKEITNEIRDQIMHAAAVHGITSLKVSHAANRLFFLVTLKPGTSAIQQLAFQQLLTEAIAPDENLEVITSAGLEKKVERFKLTREEMADIVNNALSFDDYIAQNDNKTSSVRRYC